MFAVRSTAAIAAGNELMPLAIALADCLHSRLQISAALRQLRIAGN